MRGLQDAGGKTRLLLEVKPAAKKELFPTDFDEWRGRWGLAVKAPAQDGKANQAVIKVVAKALGLRMEDVVLVSGPTSRQKDVVVDMDPELVSQWLEEQLART